jgi:hypothetical protein
MTKREKAHLAMIDDVTRLLERIIPPGSDISVAHSEPPDATNEAVIRWKPGARRMVKEDRP